MTKPIVPPGPSEGDSLGAEALAQASHSRRARKLANASLILAILSCSLLWAAVLSSQDLWAQWRPPFVWRLIPLSYLPFYCMKIFALFMGLAAIVTGHIAITKGRRDPGTGGMTWRPLFAALVGYLTVALILLWRPSFVGRLIPPSFLLFFGVAAQFIALAAFVFVHIAITRVRRVPGTGGVTWRPLFGAMVGYINVAVISLLVLSFVGKGRHNLDMAVCGNNLKRVHYALREYVNESRGQFYPPLSSQPGVLMFSAEAIPQKDDIGPRLTCPTIRYAKQPTTGPASPFDDQSYFYLGYAVRDEDDVEVFAQAYRKQIAEGGTFDGDLVVENGEGTRVLHRLSEGVGELLRAEGAVPTNEISAATISKIPVLIERDLGHINADNVEGPNRIRGAWVLYLSGDVRFVESGTWPITEKTQRILAELAE